MAQVIEDLSSKCEVKIPVLPKQQNTHIHFRAPPSKFLIKWIWVRLSTYSSYTFPDNSNMLVQPTLRTAVGTELTSV